MKIFEVQGFFVVAQGQILVFDRQLRPIEVKDHGFVERPERIRFLPVAEPITGPMPRIDAGRDDDHFNDAMKMIEEKEGPEPKAEFGPDPEIEAAVTEAEAEWAKQKNDREAAEKLWSERVAAQAKELGAAKLKPLKVEKPKAATATGLTRLRAPMARKVTSNLPALIKAAPEPDEDPIITVNLTGLSRMAQLHGEEILALHERYHHYDEIVLAINAKAKRNDHVNPRIVKSVITEMERHKRDALERLSREGAS